MLSLALSSFHCWFEDLSARRKLDQHISELVESPDSISGVEFYLSLSELVLWAKNLRLSRFAIPPNPPLSAALLRRLLALPRNSIHIPDLKRFHAGEERILGSTLKVIYEHTGIQEVTAHPDQCSRKLVERFVHALPDEVTLSLENMDLRKKDCQTLEEMNERIATDSTLGFTFDLCHWLEQGYSLSNDSVLRHANLFNDRLTKIHFSSPLRSAVYDTNPSIETSHYLMAPTRTIIPDKFLELLPQDIIWITEGVVPVGRFDLVRNELMLMSALGSRVSEVRVRAG